MAKKCSLSAKKVAFSCGKGISPGNFGRPNFKHGSTLPTSVENKPFLRGQRVPGQNAKNQSHHLLGCDLKSAAKWQKK